jgi:PqqD family protein of HPr-rel-A system
VGSNKPKVRDDLSVIDLDGELVVWDGETGDVHYLNPTASIVFELCDGSGTVEELATDIARAFGMPVERVEEDVRAIVGQYREAGLLRGSVKLAPHEAVRRGPMSGDRIPPHDGPAHDHHDHHDHHDDHDQDEEGASGHDGHAGHAHDAGGGPLTEGLLVDDRELIREDEPQST